MQKFIYCTDEEIKNKLINKLELINKQIINNQITWIFLNDNKLQFSNEEISKLQFTNKFYL